MNKAWPADLKPQGQLNRIDFGNPRMQPMIRMMQNSIRRATADWQPETGIQLSRRKFSTGGGQPFDCLVLTPDRSRGECLFCHGGGMVFPLQVSSLKVAAFLAETAGVSIWLPDYHLPPESPYPQPVQECLTVWHAIKQSDRKTVLYGESVGAALAASLAMYLRDHPEDGQPDRLMLIDPVADCETDRYPSAALDAQAVWTMKNNRHMWSLYLPEEKTAAPDYAVPIRGRVHGLPSTYLETAENDILRDEGEAFGEKLQAAGVPVVMCRIEGAWHGFDSEIDHPYTRQVLQSRVNYMKDTFTSSAD